jgi:hypothetical protein
MISREEISKGQLIPPKLEANLQLLLERLNKFRKEYAKPMIVVSGYRQSNHNRKIGGAPNSAHLSCQAADFADVDRTLTKFCTNEVLQKFDLYMEDPSHTPTWVHLQTRPTKSGRRIFIP